MKKTALTIALISIALLSAFIQYFLSKNYSTGLMQLLPYTIFSLLIIFVFARHIKNQYKNKYQAGTFLFFVLLIFYATLFLLYLKFPVEGVNSGEWDAGIIFFLWCIGIGVTLVLDVVVTNIIYANFFSPKKTG